MLQAGSVVAGHRVGSSTKATPASRGLFPSGPLPLVAVLGCVLVLALVGPMLWKKTGLTLCVIWVPQLVGDGVYHEQGERWMSAL